MRLRYNRLHDRSSREKPNFPSHKQTEIIGWPEDKERRREVLVFALEYNIIDWKFKFKTGDLGVMSSLVGQVGGGRRFDLGRSQGQGP